MLGRWKILKSPSLLSSIWSSGSVVFFLVYFAHVACVTDVAFDSLRHFSPSVDVVVNSSHSGAFLVLLFLTVLSEELVTDREDNVGTMYYFETIAI